MREIKFRAWMNIPMGPYPQTMYKVRNIQPFLDGEKLDPIMQYTGLKDKNGVDIYESDVVRNPDGQGEVRYMNAKYIIDSLSDDRDNDQYLNWHGTPDLEIIGNIYENPELLGGQENE